MVYKPTLQTKREGFYNITSRIGEAVRESGVTDEICVVFCPHTTAGIIINENADPDVVTNMLFAFDKTLPHRPEFRHLEGNTTAHLKANYMGSRATVIH